MTFAHVAILLSFMKRAEEYLVALKMIIPAPLDINGRPITSKSKDIR